MQRRIPQGWISGSRSSHSLIGVVVEAVILIAIVIVIVCDGVTVVVRVLEVAVEQ